MYALGRSILSNISISKKLEWLVTNGIGGYASSTVIGLNTRKYHGLLIASINPPVERVVLVSRLDEILIIDNKEYCLSCFLSKNNQNQNGYLYLERFEKEFYPIWVFQIFDLHIIKKICMIFGKNATLVTYKILSEQTKDYKFTVRPHFLFRDYHGNMYENPGFGVDLNFITENQFSFKPFENAPTLYVSWENAKFTYNPKWFKDNYLPEEEARGENPYEDDFSPGYFELTPNKSSLSILFSDTFCSSFNPTDILHKEETRLNNLINKTKTDDLFLKQLIIAADQFIVNRSNPTGKTVIAGYHWFSDWGRDALISLPGLTLVTGRFDDARQILLTFTKSIKNGLVPNCFLDHGNEAIYNSIDATLWLFYAVYKYLEYTDDWEFVRNNLFESLCSIITTLMNGTIYEIHMDNDDGLLTAGTQGSQLTWMDVKVNNIVVTPRHGKAVEINALWYNALKIMELLRGKFGYNTQNINILARKVKNSFQKKFWHKDKGYLIDCIYPDGTINTSLRPNQIFAVFLPFSLLEPTQEKQIINIIYKNLYTTYGLRTLSPDDENYHSHYVGNHESRDYAYHNGTVWAYLLGPFISSYLKANQYSLDAQLKANNMIEPIKIHMLQEGCIGSISEIFDAEPPHEARGCIAQAWSVAEVLRCYVEDIKGLRPTIII